MVVFNGIYDYFLYIFCLFHSLLGLCSYLFLLAVFSFCYLSSHIFIRYFCKILRLSRARSPFRTLLLFSIRAFCLFLCCYFTCGLLITMQLELLILVASSSLKPFHVVFCYCCFVAVVVVFNIVKVIGYNGVIKLQLNLYECEHVQSISEQCY